MWDHWATLLPDKDFPIVHGAGRGCRVCPAFPMMYQRMSGLVSHGEKKQLTGLSAIGNDPLLLLLLGCGGVVVSWRCLLPAPGGIGLQVRE